MTIIDPNTVSLTGILSSLVTKDKLNVDGFTFINKVTFTNTGKNDTHVYLGYAPYTKDGKSIDNRNNLYKNKNTISKVISSNSESNSVIIDSQPIWEKGTYLVINAKEDFSDFPNSSFVGRIQEVKGLDNGQAEIFFDKKIQTSVSTGDFVRIQAPSSAIYLYTNHKVLKPGEKVTFYSKREKDDSLLSFSPEAFPHGTNYVVPVILSFTVGNKEENTVQISDFEVIYYSK